MGFMKVYEQWCSDPYFDEDTRTELLALAGQETEIEDRFYRQLEFGTGGLRGVIGAGTNRMNIYTVRQATQGLANYMISCGGQEKGVAIAYDSRNMSPEFSEEAALCLNANGIKTYFREGLATRTLKGVDGANQIRKMMKDARENPPKMLGGSRVLAVRDYKRDMRTDLVTGQVTSTGLPESDVLYYELEGEAWCCVRPSGTEPKMKYYFGVKGTSLEDAERKLEALKEDMVSG